jgi:hypothetical protein
MQIFDQSLRNKTIAQGWAQLLYRHWFAKIILLLIIKQLKLTNYLCYRLTLASIQDFRIIVTKAEEFNQTNNALMASVLGGLLDYNPRLDRPSIQI